MGREKSKSGSNSQKIEWVPIEKIKPNPKNRNIHSKDQIERLAKLIQYQGWRVPLIVSTLSKKLVAGHGRLLAAKSLGLNSCPVLYQDFKDEDQENAFRVSDNEIARWAELDLAGLNVDVVDYGPDFDLEYLGLKDFELEPADKYGDKDADDTPAVRPTDIKLGDMFQLGSHRLSCNDSTNREAVERLMNGEKADMVFTDPPYNVGFNYNSYDDSKVSKDEWREQAMKWHDQWVGMSSRVVVTPGCNNLEIWCQVAPNITHIGCWVKSNANTTGRVTHLWQWEPIIFIGKFDRKRASDVFEHHVDSGFLRDKSTGNHPCPKPERLWSDIVENFSNPNDIIFEPFCGSGTTVISCEKTNRRCFGMEIDPQYVQCVIDRWERFTGQKAVKLESKPKTIVRKHGRQSQTRTSNVSLRALRRD